MDLRTVTGFVTLDDLTQPNLPRWLTYVPLGAIQPATVNAKLHDLAAIRQSMIDHGFGECPMVDERTQRLVAGHGRIEALVDLRAAGQQPPEGVVVDDDAEWLVPVLRGWSSRDDAHARAYNIGSNRLTEAGGWHNKTLALELEEVATSAPHLLESLAITSDEVDSLLARFADVGDQVEGGEVGAPPALGADDDTPLDTTEPAARPSTACCPNCGHRWELAPMA